MYHPNLLQLQGNRFLPVSEHCVNVSPPSVPLSQRLLKSLPSVWDTFHG